MTDDDLITGAAAPAADRLIGSRVALDAGWVFCVAALLIVSALLPLVDLEDVYVRTADAPLRVYTVVLPVVAMIVSTLSLVRTSNGLGAAATGVLVPSVALGGSVAGSLFFDAASPFTDAGVPATLAASTVGLVMLLRWFIYEPVPAEGVDPRPPPQLARILVVLGAALALNVVVSAARDDDGWSLPFALSTALMLLPAVVVLAAGLVRSIAANLLAAAGCAAQFVAVVVVLAVEDDIDGVGLAESATTMRTGAIGLALLAATAVVAVVGALDPRLDSGGENAAVASDDVAWRWTADDV